MTALSCGNKYIGCYILAIMIFTFSTLRSWFFHEALLYQPTFEMDAFLAQVIGYSLSGVGLIFVLASYYQLGITGTYLGDYFGILMKEKVTGFPFNVMDDPMYNGSTMIYLGDAIVARSYGGIFLSGVVFIVYKIATSFFEG